MVSEVTVSNGGRTDALQVSWQPAVGVVSHYLVRLQDGSRTVHALSVSSSSPLECSFSSLVAGRLYSVVIVTRSGSFENATVVKARTREEEQDALRHETHTWFYLQQTWCFCFLLWFFLAEPATVQNPTAVHSARDDFLRVSSVCFTEFIHRLMSMELKNLL